MSKVKFYRYLGRTALILGLSSMLLWSGLAGAQDPVDPGKGYDYVFFGYCPPYPNPGPDNRAMLLLDIDDNNSPRESSLPKHFKLLAENKTTSGRLDLESYTQHAIPNRETLLGEQDNNPERFVFIYSAGGIRIQQNAALEPYDGHYLRSVVDVVHNWARTRYLVNCECPNCDVPEAPY